jgi:RNase P subunit RPR2
MEVMIKNIVCNKILKIIMNGSNARFRGSSRRRENTMTTTCSNKLDIPLVVSMD